MFAILIDFLYSAVGWLFKAVLMKGLLFAVFALITAEFMKYLVGHIPGMDGGTISSQIGGLGSGVLYLLGMLKVDVGLPIIVGAYVARFCIRRIPFIG